LGRRLKDIEKENKEREDTAAAQRENDTPFLEVTILLQSARCLARHEQQWIGL
jgi:hypothetical protein